MDDLRDRDRAAIEALLYAYAERLDAGDFEGVADLFAAATYRSTDGGVFTGRDELLDVLRAMVVLYDGRPATQHVTTNVVVEFDGDSADSRACFTVLQALPDFPLQTVVAGRYRDRFVREVGVWRFDDRLVSMDLRGDLSRHLHGVS